MQRYIVSKSEAIDLELVDIPPFASVRDSGLGWGNQCLIVETGPGGMDKALDAFRAVYPSIRVTADRKKARRMLRS
jgi:hypothetical protein